MRLFAAATAVLLLACSLSAAQEDLPDPNSIDWGTLPVELIGVLEAKANAYQTRATGFICTERIRDVEYEGEEAKKERSHDYDYALVADPSIPERLRAMRTKPGAKGPDLKEERVELPFPEPYLWTQLFLPAVRSTYRFKVGDWHTTPYRLAIPISWQSSAPVMGGRRVTEWSGTAEMEWRTGNLVKIVAHPSLQDERLIAQMERWLQAFRFLGWSSAPPALGQELIVSFGNERDGFSFPERVELLTFQQLARNRRATISRRVVEYSNYRFFSTETTEQVVPPLTYTPPPPPPPQESKPQKP